MDFAVEPVAVELPREGMFHLVEGMDRFDRSGFARANYRQVY